ncbi:MAG TPA: transketolase [Candidatus Omnitrophota bacterium]|nr:transketolase [Candidatus Omnitrophota bacterium]
MDDRSKHLREMIIKTLQAGRRGHVGASFSLVEILRVLYDDILKYDAKNPKWPERDRCILSKGHGCIALYVLLAEKGFIAEEELWKFCKSDGILGGHPEHKVPGVEASTGSLGHGLSIGVGMAINAKFEKADHRVFVVVGDGECNEGSVWEAALCAAKHKLDNLTVIVDYNKHQSYGSTFEVLDMEPFADKWKAFGFSVREVDGHNVAQLKKALKDVPYEAGKPTAIVCHTVKGKGVGIAEHNMQWHHKSKISDEDIESLLEGLKEYAHA